MTGRVHSKESRTARSVKLSKKVACLTDGKVFNSIKEAAAFYGVAASNLSSLLAKRIKSLTSKNDGVKLSFEFWSK